MALLKPDGSLDIERINQLPYEEYMEEMGTLTQKQVKEYVEYMSKHPINAKGPVQAIMVDSPMGVDADIVVNNLRKRYKNKT